MQIIRVIVPSREKEKKKPEHVSGGREWRFVSADRRRRRRRPRDRRKFSKSAAKTKIHARPRFNNPAKF